MLDFDIQWVLIALPAAFALGWLASRFDLRQVKREARDTSKAYIKGLSLLLGEQQDKAIDTFIEVVQNDPDSADLHFALGNLFRRRGEFERAIRVHEHLLRRGDLKPVERDRAQYALAQDYMKAGLFDRAETAYRALEGSAFANDARLALLSLYERAHDWPQAVAVARRLEEAGTGSFAQRLAHYECERAQEADALATPQATALADEALEQARQIAPDAPRPLLLAGLRLRTAGDPGAAMASWDLLRARHPLSFLLVADAYAQAAIDANRVDGARQVLQDELQQLPAIELLQALQRLDSDATSVALRTQLQRHPTLSAAQLLLAQPVQQWGEDGLTGIRQAVAQAAKPMQRYRCAACGFEAQHYYWQCPGCLAWDSYPPQRMDAL